MNKKFEKLSSDCWVMKTEKFGNEPNLFINSSQPERKFNFKIRTSDEKLLDALAVKLNIKRTTLLNYLLLEGLKKELANMTDDEDTEVLIARRADEKLSCMNPLKSGFWIKQVYRDKINSYIANWAYDQLNRSIPGHENKTTEEELHSESFNALKKYFNKQDRK